MTDLYKYRIYCVTEGQYFYSWLEDTPSVCPNNNAHTIDSLKTTIVESISENEIEIKEEYIDTGRNFRCATFEIEADSQAEGNITFSFPFPISIIAGRSSYQNNDDEVSLNVSEDTIIGAITSSASVGNKTLAVPSTVTDNVVVGDIVHIVEGGADEYHYVTAIETGQITIHDGGSDAGLANALTTSALVKITKYFMHSPIGASVAARAKLGNGGSSIGEHNIKSSYVPAGRVFTARYYNSHAADTCKCYFFLEYYY